MSKRLMVLRTLPLLGASISLPWLLLKFPPIESIYRFWIWILNRSKKSQNKYFEILSKVREFVIPNPFSCQGTQFTFACADVTMNPTYSPFGVDVLSRALPLYFFFHFWKGSLYPNATAFCDVYGVTQGYCYGGKPYVDPLASVTSSLGNIWMGRHFFFDK